MIQRAFSLPKVSVDLEPEFTDKILARLDLSLQRGNEAMRVRDKTPCAVCSELGCSKLYAANERFRQMRRRRSGYRLSSAKTQAAPQRSRYLRDDRTIRQSLFIREAEGGITSEHKDPFRHVLPDADANKPPLL